MKKKTVVKLSLVLCLLLCMSLVACDDDVKDEPHKAKSEWMSNETEHWHDCATEGCTEKFEKAAHTFGDWEITITPSYGKQGEQKHVCSVCGYEETIPLAALEAKDNTVALKTGVARSKTYDGKGIALSADDFTINGDGAITFAYRVTGGEEASFSNEAPKNAGTYEVKVSVAATAEWKACETIVEYTIDKYEWTEFYNTTHTKEYDGSASIWFGFDTLEDGKHVSIVITMGSKDVGSEVKRVTLPESLRNDNYNAIDPSRIRAEITPKKVGGLKLSVKESEIDEDADPFKIVREIDGVNSEKLEVNIEFRWVDLDREEGLTFALELPESPTDKCKISFKVGNPNYVFSNDIGDLELERETT